MKTTARFALLLSSLVVCSSILAGCNDETKADPQVVKAMNDQRSAQDPSKQSGAPTNAPGTKR